MRRNYPVIGRFRYLFTMLGEFFRQYFFALDREEMPFNRAERDWVDRSSRKLDNTVAFGSTKNLTPAGTTIFVNCPFPTLTEDAVEMVPMLIGEQLPDPLQCAVVLQHLRNELRCIVDPRSPGPVARRQACRMLVQYRRGRIVVHITWKADATSSSKSERQSTACAMRMAISATTGCARSPPTKMSGCSN